MFNPEAIGDDNGPKLDELGFGGIFALLMGSLLCLFAGVATLTAIEAESPLGREPPTLSLTIGGQHQQSLYGDYAWRGVIADAFQFVAPKDPLRTHSHFSATLNLDTRLGPPSESSCKLRRVLPKDCWLGGGPDFTCWWPDEHAAAIECPPLAGATEPKLEFNVAPGLYVLVIETWWDKVGGARQHFSISVQEP